MPKPTHRTRFVVVHAAPNGTTNEAHFNFTAEIMDSGRSRLWAAETVRLFCDALDARDHRYRAWDDAHNCVRQSHHHDSPAEASAQ